MKFTTQKYLIPFILFSLLIVGGIIGLVAFLRTRSLDDRSQATHPPTFTTVTPTEITDYLANPGIGWQETKNFAAPLLPETVAYRRGDDEYSWSSINPANGVYDWTTIDADLAAAVAQGKQFSFRVVTMRGPGFGGHQVPQYVINQGARILPSGEPDYSNCVYQREWAEFVDAMRQHYDGNPNIAFIDISGYGNFNEWSFQDQTEFDPTPLTPSTVDGQARKRLADMFIGGSGTIQCRTNATQTSSVAYSYPGFQQTQLLMPFAGIRQSTEYVFSRRQDVGFRYDCLGRANSTQSVMDDVGGILDQLWPQAPIVFEYCGSRDTTPAVITEADKLLRAAHGSITHDNFPGTRDLTAMTNLLKYVGYRYHLDQAMCQESVHVGDDASITMTWQNIGYAPNYPKMGQTFQLRMYLVNSLNQIVQQYTVPTNTTQWLPADPIPGTVPNNIVNASLTIPGIALPGAYTTRVAIIDTRTNSPIQLSFEGRDELGTYPVCPITILAADATPTVFPSPSVSPTPTPSISPSPSATPSVSPSPSPSASPEVSPSPSPSVSPSPEVSPSPTPSMSPSPTPSASPSISPSPSASPQVSPTPPVSPSPSVSPTPSASPIVNPPPTPSVTPGVTPSPTATPIASVTPTPSTSPTATPLASVTPTPTSSPLASATPPIGPVCAGISASIAAPKLNDSITYTCSPVAIATHYEFRYQINGGTFTYLSAAATNSNTSIATQISQVGTYRVQCRPCTQEMCAKWEN